MNVISKRYRHEQMWEICVIDGEHYFLVRDVLKFFGYSQKSQSTIRDIADAERFLVVKGEPIRDLKHIGSIGLFIDYRGLKQFIYRKFNGVHPNAEKFEQGRELIEFIERQVLDEMNRMWIKFRKDNNIKMTPKEVEKKQAKDEYTLFDAQKDLEIEQKETEIDRLKKEIGDLSRRLSNLEDVIENRKIVKNINGEEMVPVSSLKKLFEQADVHGHIKGVNA